MYGELFDLVTEGAAPETDVLKCYENYIIWLPELSTNLR